MYMENLYKQSKAKQWKKLGINKIDIILNNIENIKTVKKLNKAFKIIRGMIR